MHLTIIEDYMDFLSLLWWLVIGHFLFDFPLQNDFLAVHKNPMVNGKPNEIWIWCLTAHSFLHTLPVMWLTGRVDLALMMLSAHFAIDYIKCRGWIDFHKDQILHLFVLLWIAVCAVIM